MKSNKAPGIDGMEIDVKKNADSALHLEPAKLYTCCIQRQEAPKLFSACLELIFRNLNWENMGINIDGEYLNHLRFADGIILISHTITDIKTMIEELNRESKKCGLKINITKTKISSIRKLNTQK